MYNWLIFLLKLSILQIVISENVEENYNSTVNEFLKENGRSKALSRQKRFVIFPDGSSLQLVFCNQMLAVIPIGDIFIFGYTAALAWQLPTDPKYIYMFKDLERPLRRSDEVTKTINYFDENGRIIAKVPYKKRLIVNPAFAKRSVHDNQISSKTEFKKISRKKMHENQTNRDYLKTKNMDKDTIEFHRNNRLELYKKLEALISRLGRDGKQCVLYKLCESAKHQKKQGTFLQEILTAVFTLPKGDKFDQDEHKEYDAAHAGSDDCLARFPGCTENY